MPPRISSNFAAPKQIVQAADSVPAVAVALDDQAMPALLVAATVILGEETDQQSASLAGQSGGERDLARRRIEIVDEQNRVVAPIIADDQHRRIAARDDREIAPADLRHLLAH